MFVQALRIISSIWAGIVVYVGALGESAGSCGMRIAVDGRDGDSRSDLEMYLTPVARCSHLSFHACRTAWLSSLVRACAALSYQLAARL